MGKAKRLTANALALASNDALLIERITASHGLYNQGLADNRARWNRANDDCALAHVSRVNDAITAHRQAVDTLTDDSGDDPFDD